MRRTWMLLFLAACSDYHLASKPDPVVVPSTETGAIGDTAETTPTTPTTPPPEHSATPVVHTGTVPWTCDDVTLPVLAFRGSPTFTQRSDPTDGQGRVFWNPAADTGSYTAVTLPDTATPPGSDRAYVATFTLTDIPLNLSLELQSDDGVWVWLNGTAVGHWGGAWQQEGCVNENANCLVTTVVPPIDVTSLLVPGTNTLAARVSNSVENNFFEIIPRCIEPL